MKQELKKYFSKGGGIEKSSLPEPHIFVSEFNLPITCAVSEVNPQTILRRILSDTLPDISKAEFIKAGFDILGEFDLLYSIREAGFYFFQKPNAKLSGPATGGVPSGRMRSPGPL